MNFLDEKTALQAIRKLLANASAAKIAVAFWGRDAKRNLGLDQAELDLTIICNLDSGACNPNEIGQLMKTLPHGRVLSDPRLHGKVYWTPDGAVVGSSNASTNGLALEGEASARWAEANILIDDRATLASILKWFEQRRQSSYEIEPAHLKAAKELWNKRSQAAPTGGRITSNLLDAYRRAPRHPSWKNVRLAFWSEEMDADGEREMLSLKEKNPLLEELLAYQDWVNFLVKGEFLIDFDVSSGTPEFNGIYRVTEFSSEHISLVSHAKSISIPGFPKLEIPKKDQEYLESAAIGLFRAHSKDKMNALVPFEKAMEEIDEKDTAQKINKLD